MSSSIKYFLRCTLAIAIVSLSNTAFSQEEEEDNECVRILRQAEKAYEDGLIETVDDKVRPCLEGNELSKEDKLQAYKLIAMSHLYDGKDDLAEEAMLNFLKLEPEYQIQPGVDPKEFTEMYGDYHTSPLYTLGVYIGTNWALANSYKEYGAYNTATDKKKYKSSASLMLGLRGSRYIYKGLNVHLDLTFMQSRFLYNQDILESYTNVEPNQEPLASPQRGVSIESIESHATFSIPISFSYTFRLQKEIRPYAMAGFETKFLITASNQLQKSYLDQSAAPVEVPDVEKFIEQRNTTTFSALFAAGVKYKIKGGDIYIEGRYAHGLSEQVKRGEIDVNDDERIWNFYQQDNDFSLNNLNVSIGYTKYLYKPRKMKESKSPKQEKEPKAKKEKKDKKESKEDSDSNQRQVIE